MPETYHTHPDSTLTAIANAIRAKNGSQNTYTPAQMATAIANIPSGGDTDLLELMIERSKKGYTGAVTIDMSNFDITAIGSYAFYKVNPTNASGSTQQPVTVILPQNKIKAIYDFAFNGVPVESINLEDLYDTGSNNDVYIGMYGLAGLSSGGANNCPRYTSLVLPRQIYTGNYAFAYCYYLQSVSGQIEGPSTGRTLGNYAFRGCTALKTVNLPNLHYLPNYGLFDSCTALEQIRLKSLISLVGTYCFTDMNDAFPALELIDYGQITTAFGTIIKNTTIKVAVFRNSSLVTCSNIGCVGDTTSPIRAGTGYVLVPRALIEDYKVESNWSALDAAGTQFLAVEDYTTDGTTTGDLDDTKIALLLA